MNETAEEKLHLMDREAKVLVKSHKGGIRLVKHAQGEDMPELSST